MIQSMEKLVKVRYEVMKMARLLSNTPFVTKDHLLELLLTHLHLHIRLRTQKIIMNLKYEKIKLQF